MQEKVLEQDEQMTERLFDQDSYLSEFTAYVLSCEPYQDGYRVVLNRTAFFPEGGGQFGDIGWLELCREGDFVCEENGRKEIEAARLLKDRAAVLDTQEKDGIIYHRTDRPFEVGAEVIGRLDFAERFSRMQQHTGEHIVSGIVHRLYGYDNVGFHLGADVTTFDFNGELTAEQVLEAETLANQAVFDNLPVEVLYPSKEELAAFAYRSKIEIEGQVRLVSIPGVDLCACCAPHVSRTGEIGLIRLLACERHRGGCRVTMVCGARALADCRQKQKSVTEVSVALSAKPEEIGAAVLHQKEQMQKLREQLNRFQASYLEQELAKISGDEKNVCIFVEDFDNIAARNFVNDAAERCSGICGAFVGTDAGGYRYILGSRTIDVRAAARALNAAFEGKGGGKPEMVQGSLTGAKAEIEKLLKKEVGDGDAD